MPEGSPPDRLAVRQAMDTARALITAQVVEVSTGDPDILISQFEDIRAQLQSLPGDQVIDVAGGLIQSLSRLAALIAAFPGELLRDATQQQPGLRLPPEITRWLEHPQSVLNGTFTVVETLQQERQAEPD